MNRMRYIQDMVFLIESLLTGRVQRFADGDSSAIAKTAVDGPRNVLWMGIDGDAQADLSVHGGPDKAIHHYPRDHYEDWREALGPMALLDQAGAFGENISTSGLTEDVACIGDRYRLGTAIVRDMDAALAGVTGVERVRRILRTTLPLGPREVAGWRLWMSFVGLALSDKELRDEHQRRLEILPP